MLGRFVACCLVEDSLFLFFFSYMFLVLFDIIFMSLFVCVAFGFSLTMLGATEFRAL
jgi:hypothetical protein